MQPKYDGLVAQKSEHGFRRPRNENCRENDHERSGMVVKFLEERPRGEVWRLRVPPF